MYSICIQSKLFSKSGWVLELSVFFAVAHLVTSAPRKPLAILSEYIIGTSLGPNHDL